MVKTYEIVDLIKEHDKIYNFLLKKQKVDFSHLRKICSDLNDRYDELFTINVTNRELWRSMNDSCKDYLNYGSLF